MTRTMLILLLLLLSFQQASLFARDSSPDSHAERPSQVRRTLFHPDFATPEVLAGRFDPAIQGNRIQSAFEFFESQSSLYKLAQPQSELRLVSEFTDDLGHSHVRFQQIYHGLPVDGCQVIVHFDPNGKIYLVGGQTAETPNININPQILSSQAKQKVLSKSVDKAGAGVATDEGELMILPQGKSLGLVWRFDVSRPTGKIIRRQVYVDAISGQVVLDRDNVPTDGPTFGTGPDCRDSIRTVPGFILGGVNKMINTGLSMFVPPTVSLTGVIAVMKSRLDQQAIVSDPDNDNLWDDVDSLKAAVAAQYYAQKTYEYYLSTFGRNSYDGNGHSIYLVTYDSTNTNAYWGGNGRAGFYGGVPGQWLPWSGSLDIVAHEITHGVTEATAGLIYQDQSGALSESYSDFFGAMVDRDDWQIGEEIRIAAPYVLRNMADPHNGLNPNFAPFGYQPERMSEFQNYSPDYDNGGVHINSGIPNRAGYLVASTIGREKAENIWYRTLTTYLTPASSFAFWGEMTIQAAADLFGQQSPEVSAVEAALDSVELGVLYPDPIGINPFHVTAGSTADTAVWMHNRAFTDFTVSSAASAHGTFTVGGVFPQNLAGRDSLKITLHADATTAQICDIGSEYDTLLILTTAPDMPSFKIPIRLTTTLSDIGSIWTLKASDCLSYSIFNTPEMNQFYHIGEVALTPGLFSGSLVVALLDGLDTVAFHNYGDDDDHAKSPFPPIDQILPHDNPGSYGGNQVNIVSPDGRIHGFVRYYADLAGDFRDCEYIIADYTLFNPCDTSISLRAGTFFDFDIGTSTQNYAGYDAAYHFAYVTNQDSSLTTAAVALSGNLRSLRSINNTALIWPAQTLLDSDAYRELGESSNTAGTALNDWSTLISFGDATLSSSDTLHFQVGLIFVEAGPDSVRKIIDVIYPVFDSSMLAVEPPRILEFIGETSSENPPDSQIVIDFLGQGDVSWQASNSSNWLQLHENSGLSGTPLRFSYHCEDLSLGVYRDTIVVNSPEAKYGPQRCVVQLTVTPGDGRLLVPSEYATIQEAIDAAADGDRIEVAPGDYSANLNFLEKRIQVNSTAGAHSTILRQANLAAPLATNFGSNDEWSALTGFEITGPSRSDVIVVDSSSQVTIANNFFHDLVDSVYQVLSVIRSEHSMALVLNNLFYDNPYPNWTVNLHHSRCKLYNNTFDHCRRSIYQEGDLSVARRNMVTRDLSTGIYGFYYRTASGNNSWSSHTENYHPEWVPFLIQNYSVDPRYCGVVTKNFGLDPLSIGQESNNSLGVHIGAYLGDCSYSCGDADGSQFVSISDAVYLINYIFAGGPAPSPYSSGDADCNQILTISDAVLLINYIFASGPAPCASCP